MAQQLHTTDDFSQSIGPSPFVTDLCILNQVIDIPTKICYILIGNIQHTYQRKGVYHETQKIADSRCDGHGAFRLYMFRKRRNTGESLGAAVQRCTQRQIC